MFIGVELRLGECGVGPTSKGGGSIVLENMGGWGIASEEADESEGEAADALAGCIG
jgi:hypothetical protein